MCNRCQNIKAQMIFREMHKRLLNRNPTREEMQKFSELLPKPGRIRLSKVYKNILEVVLQDLRRQAIEGALKNLPREQLMELYDKIILMIRE